MDELEDRLRGLKVAEPPLGFDPDEVATTAAKRIRNRRAVAMTGTATLAVIVAAVVALGPGGTPAFSPAASSPASSPAAPARWQSHALRHLKDVLPNVLTGAKDIEVRDFAQVNDWDLGTSEIRYTDAAGKKRGINLTISGPVATKEGYPREGRCDPANMVDGIGPDRKPMRCVELPQPGGGLVVISETTPKSLESLGGEIIVGEGVSTGKVTGRNAVAFSAGGGSVNIGDLGVLGGGVGSADAGPALTDEQLIRLVTDPEFIWK